jgi:hypothetical protein
MVAGHLEGDRDRGRMRRERRSSRARSEYMSPQPSHAMCSAATYRRSRKSRLATGIAP